MNNPARKIELGANIAIIILVILVGAALLKDHFLANPSRSVPEKIPPETRVSLAGVDWEKNGQTLLMVLQKGCHYCSESAPFYRQLAEEVDKSRSTRLVAVLPQDVSVGKQYLNDLGVPIEDVRQALLRSLDVKGTPTLILVNDKGQVIDSWIGKLPADAEAKVLESVRARH